MVHKIVILKSTDPTPFPAILEVECDRKKRVKDDYKVFVRVSEMEKTRWSWFGGKCAGNQAFSHGSPV